MPKKKSCSWSRSHF